MRHYMLLFCAALARAGLCHCGRSGWGVWQVGRGPGVVERLNRPALRDGEQIEAHDIFMESLMAKCRGEGCAPF